MSSNYDNNIMNESMLEAYIVETKQQIENIEEALLQTEKLKYFEPQKIDEIFRSMHSIKGASAMMMYDNISTVAHKIEDLLYFIRENPNEEFDVEKLIDVIFEGVDFLSFELEKVKSKGEISDFPEDLVEDILVFLNELKTGNVKVKTSSDTLSNTYYHAKLKFLPDCEMENLRAFAMVHALTDISKQLDYTPKELAENPEAAEQIREHGFEIFIETVANYDEIKAVFSSSVFLDEFELNKVESFKTISQASLETIESEEVSLAKNTDLIARFLKDILESESKNMDVDISIKLRDVINPNTNKVVDIARNYGLLDDSIKENKNPRITLYSFKNNKFDNKVEVKLNLERTENSKTENFESLFKARKIIKDRDNVDLINLVDLAIKSDIEASRDLIVMVSKNKAFMPELPKQIKLLLEDHELFEQVKENFEERKE